jgi:UDP-glucuronate 4-epimerase
MKVLVTGAAGFIGFHTTQALCARGDTVIGIDCLNEYYDVTLKHARLKQLDSCPNFQFIKGDIADPTTVESLMKQHPDITGVVHLAAQAGVRYSLIDPYAYIQANIQGMVVLLENAKKLKDLKHFVYASSSSVYGSNTKMPFSIDDPVDHPISLYAATKRADELMAHAYSHLFGIPTTGLRYFTVYGPWGRPDMAAFIFAKSILAGEEIKVFNHGKMRRNFTFVADIVGGTLGCLDHPPQVPKGKPPYALYNIGNSRSEDLMDFIHILEENLGHKAKMRFEPLQPGDVEETIADIAATQRDFGFEPKTNIKEGLAAFVTWYKGYYQSR